MENRSLTLAILNLSGELPQELAEYFRSRGIKVVDPLQNEERLKWTHILTKDLHDFNLIRKTYQTVENDVKLISLTKVEDPQNFILANGKLVVDEAWAKSSLGNFILDKFFQEYGGITLVDNYPKFTELGAFNVTNPFSTGDYVDRLVHKGLSGDFPGLAIKTYFDHAVMYLAGLKNKGKAGLPIEVTYGTFEDFFGLQLHFFAQNLLIDDVTASLSANMSRRSEEYLLNVAVQSTDFFDFTYLAEVKKVVITALWSKEERLRFENRGLMLTTLAASSALQNLPLEGATSQLLDDGPIEDQSSKVMLPEQEQETVSGEGLSESIATKLSSDMELEQIKQLLNGSPEEDDLVNIVKGTFEEEAQAIKISGGKLDVDQFAVRISSGIKEKAPGNMTVKSLGEKLPEKIKTGLFDFAKGLNKGVDDLDDDDIHVFKNTEVPKLVGANGMSAQMRAQLKEKLEQGIKSEFMEDSAAAALDGLQGEDDVLRVKQLLKDSIKSSLESNFQLTKKDSVTELERDLLVKSLSQSLNEDEDKIRDAVVTKGAEEKPLFNAPPSERERELQKQLQAMQVESDGLKSKLKTVMVEVKILKEARQTMADMQAKAKEASAGLAQQKMPDQDEQLRKHFQAKLAANEALSQHEQKKLQQLLEREAKAVEMAREKDVEVRRLQIEGAQKEAYFGKELEKVKREAKSKDLMLVKTKETYTKALEKKDEELEDVKMKLDNLSIALSSGPTQSQVQQVKDLEKQNQNMAKMVEMYKAKLAGVMSQTQGSKETDNSKEEVRKLQMINQQFKNQVDAAKKEVQKYQDKVAYDMNQMTAMRADKAKLDAQIKQLTQQLKKQEAAPQTSDFEVELKKAQVHNSQLENQIKDLTIKLKEAETKLIEAMKNQQKAAGSTNDDKKVAHLEGSVKKLTADLIEARNQSGEMKKEVNKLRQEKTALQNQLDKIKKDTEKASKAAAPNAPKKPEGGGPAGGGKAA